MAVKTEFSIKDLENLSGVKAHTIRIWEKRYALLEPNRTDTNIRNYDMSNLTKLLNATFLYRQGFKISKIAELQQDEIERLIAESELAQTNHYALHLFKQSMFEFDHHLFNKTYRNLSKKESFDFIFFDLFMPLLNEIGLLWQTGTIDPVHERFISELIKQKIIENIINAQETLSHETEPSFALFLPYEEIHEIGLLYANYILLSEGHQTLYLGSNIPLDNLKHLIKHYSAITFLSYFTVKPDDQSVENYVIDFYKHVKPASKFPLWLMGYKLQDIAQGTLGKNIHVIHHLKELRAYVKSQKV
jgi:DNA-binding transcriptional MerR regulator